MREELLEGLNEAQRQAVTHTSGPLLIVAGAGTGKTTVLTKRYAYLLNQTAEHKEEKCTTANILALTFTDKAAGEMEDRILGLLSTGTYDFWISTFHGFCQRILEAHALEIGLPNQFRVLSTTDAWLLLKRRFTELPLDHYRPLGNPVKFLRSLLQHISRAKDEGVTPEKYLAFAREATLNVDQEAAEGERKRLQELADVYSAYRKILLEEGCLDFGDLILETLRLFRERPMILELYRNQFTYVMVDEFQDTNWAQYELLKLLVGKRRNLTVVGDDDQAIYKFRGASLANILQFRDDFPEAKTVALTQNYRSKREILDCAYEFIKKNDPHRLEVKLQDTGLSKRLIAERGEGGEIETVWAPSVEEEAESVIEDIKSKKQALDTGWNDFAILVRSNDGAEPFVRAFERHGIPFQFMALRGLYGKPAILDVIALLSLLDGYHESSAVWRALALPCYAISAGDRAELIQLANRKGMPLWFAVVSVARGDRQGSEISDEGASVLRKMVATVEALAASARRDQPLKILQAALDQTGYLAYVVKLPEREKREALQWLNGFASRMKRYEAASNDPSLREFLEELRLEIESGEEGALDTDPDSGPELVKILTVHAAKGLEFKHVYVVSLVEQRFPSRARPEPIPLPDGLVKESLEESDHHLEEERRLLYVALTRAKDTLMITGASDYGGSRAKKPSPFWAEAKLDVPESLLVGRDVTKLLMPPEEVALTEAYQEKSLYPLKRRFSFTQLAAFRKCPLQYKFAHIYRIPVLGAYQKSFGQSVHLTFQRVLELHRERTRAVQGDLFGSVVLPMAKGAGLRVTEEEALQILEDAWIDEWYETRARHDEYYQKGQEAVRQFCRAYAGVVPDVVEIEKDFTLLLGQHSLKGKIDRVDRLSDGSMMVLDYKTGTAKETLEAEDKEQLYLYQIALEERGLKVGRLAYVYVMEWELREVEPLVGPARQKFLDKLEARMDEILGSDYQPTPEPFTCRFCDFKNICEFRKL
jgi:DNA helicase-2/ATP-dependent DNA helicase PcrA